MNRPPPVPRWVILKHLSTLNHGDTIASIASACEYPSTLAASRAVFRLAKAGLVKSTDAEDAKNAAHRYSLTVKGSGYLQRALLRQGISTEEFSETFWGWLREQRRLARAARRAAETDAERAWWDGHQDAYGEVLKRLEREG